MYYEEKIMLSRFSGIGSKMSRRMTQAPRRHYWTQYNSLVKNPRDIAAALQYPQLLDEREKTFNINRMFEYYRASNDIIYTKLLGQDVDEFSKMARAQIVNYPQKSTSTTPQYILGRIEGAGTISMENFLPYYLEIKKICCDEPTNPSKYWPLKESFVDLYFTRLEERLGENLTDVQKKRLRRALEIVFNGAKETLLQEDKEGYEDKDVMSMTRTSSETEYSPDYTPFMYPEELVEVSEKIYRENYGSKAFIETESGEYFFDPLQHMAAAFRTSKQKYMEHIYIPETTITDSIKNQTPLVEGESNTIVSEYLDCSFNETEIWALFNVLSYLLEEVKLPDTKEGFIIENQEAIKFFCYFIRVQAEHVVVLPKGGGKALRTSFTSQKQSYDVTPKPLDGYANS